MEDTASHYGCSQAAGRGSGATSNRNQSAAGSPDAAGIPLDAALAHATVPSCGVQIPAGWSMDGPEPGDLNFSFAAGLNDWDSLDSFLQCVGGCGGRKHLMDVDGCAYLEAEGESCADSAAAVGSDDVACGGNDQRRASACRMTGSSQGSGYCWS